MSNQIAEFRAVTGADLGCETPVAGAPLWAELSHDAYPTKLVGSYGVVHNVVNNMSLVRLSVLCVLLFSVNAQAGGPRSYISALAGPAFGVLTVTGSHLSLGGRIGTGIGPETWAAPSIGIMVETLADSARVSGVTVDGRSTTVLGELLCRRVGGSGLYFGARAGVDISTLTVSSASSIVPGNGTAFTYGPVMGYEFALGSAVSFDVDLTWVSVASHTVTFTTGSAVDIDYSQYITSLAGLSLHF